MSPDDVTEILLRGEKATIEGFGSFTVSSRRAFMGDGGVYIPAVSIPVFRTSKELKLALNNGEEPAPLMAPWDGVVDKMIAGRKTTVRGFGTFTVSTRRAFQGHNPATGKAMTVPAVRIPVFRAGERLKQALNPPRQHPVSLDDTIQQLAASLASIGMEDESQALLQVPPGPGAKGHWVTQLRELEITGKGDLETVQRLQNQALVLCGTLGG